ncbi:ribose-phosphate diphosphokinase [Microbulbifer hainanensis]|uniref:ribose-phosphate diphosphokinase n=1 Tax=Microbulbifer hainanensis TaxID=2735675 RepID=UPI0018676F3F|nr:ribose-phosphate diphosphokinase [Microbulbifer hainanensis]
MKPLLFTLEAGLPLFQPLCRQLAAEIGELESRQFPDGESYLRIPAPVTGRHCVLLADLSHPDPKFLPLLFLVATLRELGAASVGLVAPYLCYMRQDRRFQPGEALTSRIFAQHLSRELDWLVTVDPHLHRYHSLDEIYTIPARTLTGVPLLADWLRQRGETCLLVGPDAESRQWVAEIAAQTGLPFIVGHKERRGDRDVVVTLPAIPPEQTAIKSAVIVDDVIASGHTILQTIASLRSVGIETIDCIAVHGVFAGNAEVLVRGSGLRQLVTSNSIPGSSAKIDLSPLLAEPIRELLAGAGGSPTTVNGD